MSERWVDELIPDQPQWVRDLVDNELRNREARLADAKSNEGAWEATAQHHYKEARALEKRLAEAKTWLSFIYNCRGYMTDEAWAKFKPWCEANGIHLNEPRFDQLPDPAE